MATGFAMSLWSLCIRYVAMASLALLCVASTDAQTDLPKDDLQTLERRILELSIVGKEREALPFAE